MRLSKCLPVLGFLWLSLCTSIAGAQILTYAPQLVATAVSPTKVQLDWTWTARPNISFIALEVRAATSTGAMEDGEFDVVAVLARDAREHLVVLEAAPVDVARDEADLAAPIHGRRGGFADYLLGVASEFHDLGRSLPNLDVLVHSDIPMGAGLASSAALEVAFASLLEQVAGPPLPPIKKALLCQRAEHAFGGTPCGIMDMLVSIAGTRGSALLIDCRSNRTESIALPTARLEMLAIDTGVRHELATGAYAERRHEAEAAARLLGVRTLRDADEAQVRAASLPEPLRRRALPVTTENARVLEAVAALRADDLARFGELMFASHASLRDDFEVSCAELDVLVEAAATLHGSGVYGARMTGGGFGGCVVAACDPARSEAVGCALRNAFEERFGRVPSVMRVG